MRKLIFVLLGFVLLGSGLVMAYPVNATVDSSYNYGRWAAVNAAGNFTTEGGNVSEVNVTAAAQLTDRWAGMFGNITATEIVLKSSDDPGGTHLYNWTALLDGEICVSPGPSFTFSAIQEATANNVDGLWSFGAVADNVTETFTGTGCALMFTAVTPTDTDNATYIDHAGLSSFRTCAFKDITSPESRDDLAFCTKINTSGINYKGMNYHYELMVPTRIGVGLTETYYFFVEIN